MKSLKTGSRHDFFSSWFKYFQHRNKLIDYFSKTNVDWQSSTFYIKIWILIKCDVLRKRITKFQFVTWIRAHNISRYIGTTDLIFYIYLANHTKYPNIILRILCALVLLLRLWEFHQWERFKFYYVSGTLPQQELH